MSHRWTTTGVFRAVELAAAVEERRLRPRTAEATLVKERHVAPGAASSVIYAARKALRGEEHGWKVAPLVHQCVAAFRAALVRRGRS
jgi:hypothetical protein